MAEEEAYRVEGRRERHREPNAKKPWHTPQFTVLPLHETAGGQGHRADNPAGDPEHS